MSDAEEGRVFLTFDEGWGADPESDEPLHPAWHGGRQSPDWLDGPSFNDASEAVRWWLDQGDRWIIINLDGTEYLWAGIGPPPLDEPGGSPMGVFSHEDPRGRPEGAMAMADQRRRHVRQQLAEGRIRNERAMADKLGADLKRRRQKIGISVQELAQRIDVTREWIENVEAGRTSLDVPFRTWVDLVWATREPFPDPQRSGADGSEGRQRRFSYIGDQDLYLAEEVVRRVIEDDWE